MDKRTLEIGDVVQINPDYGNGFGGMLLVVTESKEWGCQGYLMSDVEFDAVKYKGVAYLRVKFADMEYVGKLHWLRETILDEKTDE